MKSTINSSNCNISTSTILMYEIIKILASCTYWQQTKFYLAGWGDAYKGGFLLAS